METNQKATVCIREYRIIKKRLQKGNQKNTTQKKDRETR